MTDFKNKKDILFIWIPKTSGTSIYKSLKNYGCIKLKNPPDFYEFNNLGCVTFGHVNVFNLLDRQIVKRKYLNSAFKFCFVRNPWDRMVSLYYYNKYDEIMAFHDFVYLVEKKIKIQKTLIGNVFQIFFNLPKIGIILSRLTEKYKYFPLPKVGLYNTRGLSQANPQVNWITNGNSNEIIVDFIGKFENLSEDIDYINQTLDISLKIGHLNKTNHKNYRSYYNENLKDIIKKIYTRDIDLFEYEF